jgi:hypothetical protein
MARSFKQVKCVSQQTAQGRCESGVVTEQRGSVDRSIYVRL